MISPYIRAEIIAAVANGMSLREAEQKFAVAKTTISRLTKGGEPRKIFTAETKAEAIAAVEDGEPRNDIAKRLNCSTTSIESWLRAARPRDRTAERKEQKKPPSTATQTFHKPGCSRCKQPFTTRSRTAILCSQCQEYANNNDF